MGIDPDVLDTVQDMRANGGELDLSFPAVLVPSNQRALRRELWGMRRLGYAFQIDRDRLWRICRVRLLEH